MADTRTDRDANVPITRASDASLSSTNPLRQSASIDVPRRANDASERLTRNICASRKVEMRIGVRRRSAFANAGERTGTRTGGIGWINTPKQSDRRRIRHSRYSLAHKIRSERTRGARRRGAFAIWLGPEDARRELTSRYNVVWRHASAPNFMLLRGEGDSRAREEISFPAILRFVNIPKSQLCGRLN